MRRKMIYMVSFVLVLGLAGLSSAAVIGFQAESGALGAHFDPPLVDPNALGGQYITIETTAAGGNPGNENRIVTYTVTFPEAGTYDLYARLYIDTSSGQGAADNDSMFYGNGFGTKPVRTANDWILCNSLDQSFNADEWSWINLSEDTGAAGENGVSFEVPAGELTQTLQIGAREDGLRMDAFAFATASETLTDEELDLAVPVERKAFGGDPADGSLVAETSVVLSWQPGPDAAEHHVYFSDNINEVSDRTAQADKGLTSELTYAVSGLTPGTVYYWAIDEVSGSNIWPGDVWSFQIASEYASNPDPYDGDISIATDVVLAWSPGVTAVSHVVYLDKDKANIEARSNCLVNAANANAANYSPGPLDLETTYYWAVDEVVDPMEGIVFTGEVWSFTTRPDIQISDPNLVGWWTFDEGAGSTALDWSGHGNHGVIHGDPDWVVGYSDYRHALAFDGLGDYVDCGNAATLDLSDQITVACWMRVDVFEQQDQSLITKGENAWRLVRDDFNNQLRFDCGDVGSVTGRRNVNDGEWHHALGMYDGSRLSLYVDGALDATGTRSGPLTSDPNITVFIGDTNRPGSGPRAWNGLIDDVRIYNKALTAQEIQTIQRISAKIAWAPSPLSGSSVGLYDVTALSWRAGDDAVEHDVYFGMDPNAVEAANTSDTTGLYQGRQPATTFVPSEALQVGQTYYWRIDEYNADGTISKGKVWNFWIVNYLLVDDFESYTADGCGRIYYTWHDGFSYNANVSCDISRYEGNGTRMTVGVVDESYGPEKTIVYGGLQSLPLSYDNTVAPFYSEADRTFDQAQDWTTLYGMDLQALSLWIQGRLYANNGFTADGSSYTVVGSGVDILEDYDEFHFVYQSKALTGAGSISAKIERLDNTHRAAKAGVMIRNGLEPDAEYAAVVSLPDGDIVFQYRTVSGADANIVRPDDYDQSQFTLPYYVKISTEGGMFTASMSADGQDWVDINEPQYISMVDYVYAGLAVSSHVDAATPCEAVFSNVDIQGTDNTLDVSQDIGLLTNDPAALYVTIEDASEQTVTVLNQSDDPNHVNAVTQNEWIQWLIPLSELESQVDLTQVKKMVIGIGDGQTTGEGKLYVDDIAVLLEETVAD